MRNKIVGECIDAIRIGTGLWPLGLEARPDSEQDTPTGVSILGTEITNMSLRGALNKGSSFLPINN